ncbi:GSCOCG00000800001-RA-CDS [Cotesia congregata]|nr:GSCOCG00000800001-RA-CDS [Cotesia congregata]
MSQIKIINFSNTCRVCLKQGIRTMSPIFGDTSNNIADVLSYLADVQINPHDGLPAAICLNCKRKVEEFYKFRNLIEISDKTLRSYLKINNENDLISEDEQENIFPDNNDSGITYVVTMPNDSTQIWDTADTLELKKNADEQVEILDEDVKIDLYNENENNGDKNKISNVQKQKKYIDIFCQLCSKKFNSVKDLKDHVDDHCLLSETHEKPQNKIKEEIFLKTKVKEEKPNSDEFYEKSEPDNSQLLFDALKTKSELVSQEIVKLNSKSEDIKTERSEATESKKKRRKKTNEPKKTRNCQFPRVRNKLNGMNDQGGICLGFKFKDSYFESVILCKFCSQELTPEMINDHASHCLIQNRNLVCDECGQQFDETAELKSHKATHSSQPLTCIHCNTTFSNINTYNTHMKRHTLGSRFNCETCGKKFFSNSELVRHVQKHLNNKKFACNNCDASFVTRPELTRHLKYHTGFKKFKCHICGKAYYESGHLKVHMRYHSGEKPFICQTCGKTFITKSKLLRHEKIHVSKT